MSSPKSPPDRVVLRDLVLRRWAHADATALTRAVQESFDHLHAWMPWAAVPPSLADMQSFIAGEVRKWDAGEGFTYAIFDASENNLFGSIGVHDRVGPGGGEIGYWVHVDQTGRGVATTTAAVVTGVLLSDIGAGRAEIHCDKNNTASATVPSRLGYRLDRIEEHQKDAPGECGERLIWIMAADAYPGSAAECHANAAAC